MGFCVLLVIHSLTPYYHHIITYFRVADFHSPYPQQHWFSYRPLGSKTYTRRTVRDQL